MSDEWADQRAAVRAVLAGKAITQTELAAAVGITPKHLSQMLTGHAGGTVQLWSRIAAVLGCTWTLSVLGRRP